MFLINFNKFCFAKKTKLSTVHRFCTHFHRNTLVFAKKKKKKMENSNSKKMLKRKNLFFLDLIRLKKKFISNVSTPDNSWSTKFDKTTRIGNKSIFDQLKSNMEV